MARQWSNIERRIVVDNPGICIPNAIACCTVYWLFAEDMYSSLCSGYGDLAVDTARHKDGHRQNLSVC